MDYRISTTLAGLSADNLLAEPHPAEFFEETDLSNEDLTGAPVALGKAHTIWNYDKQILQPAAWGQLIGFVGSAPFAWVYIVTRTNQIVSSKYQYKSYYVLMRRPTGKSRDGYRYEDVKVEFEQMTEV